MLQRIRRLRIKSALSVFLIAALLLAQGVRVCLHAPHEAHDGPAAQRAALHLESELSTLGEHDDSAADWHYSLFVILKKLSGDSPLAALAALILVLFAPARVPRPAPSDFTPSAAGAYRWRPPLRAPPY